MHQGPGWWREYGDEKGTDGARPLKETGKGTKTTGVIRGREEEGTGLASACSGWPEQPRARGQEGVAW